MRNDILFKLRAVDELPNKKKELEEETEIKAINKFLSSKSNSLVIYSGKKEKSGEYLSTMFCPNPYIYQENVNQIKITLITLIFIRK
jgi:hypothetical protein